MTRALCKGCRPKGHSEPDAPDENGRVPIQIHIVGKSKRKRVGESDFEVTFVTNGEIHNVRAFCYRK